MEFEESLDIETFYFDYPSWNILTALIPVEDMLDSREYNLIQACIWIENLDDFALVSETQFHMWTGIPMRKIRALYRSAEKMIRKFHDTKRVEIEEIRELRAAGH